MLTNESDTWLETGLADSNLTRTPDPDDYDPHRRVVQEGKARMMP